MGLNRSRIDARRELAAFGQQGVCFDVGVGRNHILYAGHSERSSEVKRSLGRPQTRRLRWFRNELANQTLSRILENASGISVCVANDLASGRGSRLIRDAGQLHRQSVSE